MGSVDNYELPVTSFSVRTGFAIAAEIYRHLQGAMNPSWGSFGFLNPQTIGIAGSIKCLDGFGREHELSALEIVLDVFGLLGTGQHAGNFRTCQHPGNTNLGASGAQLPGYFV